MKSEPFTHSAGDLMEVTRLRVRPPLWYTLAFFAVMITAAAGASLVASFGLSQLDMPSKLLVVVAVMWAAIFIARPFYQRTIYVWTTRNAPPMNAPGVVSIDESGFSWTSDMSRGWVAWRAILAIRRGKQTSFYFTQPNSAYAVPDRAFATDRAREDFHAAAHAYWEQAKSKSG